MSGRGAAGHPSSCGQDLHADGSRTSSSESGHRRGPHRLTLDQVRGLGDERARYEPAIGEDERASLLDGWHRALERSRKWAAE